MRRPLLIITAQPENAKKLYEQISIWLTDKDLNVFPEPDNLPYQRTITDFTIEQERLQVLFSLTTSEKSRINPLIIASVPALMQKTLSKINYESACISIVSGTDINPLALLERWETLGYQMENMVEVPGTMSRRGGIVDVFPPSSDYPVRLEFFGNTIESIRLFDSSTQRSVKVIKRIAICPANEILPVKDKSELIKLNDLDLSKCNPESRERFEQEIAQIASGNRPPNLSFYCPFFNEGCLLDYLPENSLIIMDENQQIRDEVEYLDKQAMELRDQRLEDGELPLNYPHPYFKWDEIADKLRNRDKLYLLTWVGSENAHLLRLDFNSAPNYAGQLPVLISKSRDFLNQKYRLIYVSNQAGRLSELMEEQGVYAAPVKEIEKTPATGTLTLVQGSLDEGWVMGNTYLLTDREIFGFVKERRLVKKRAVKRHKLLVDLKPGDYVVHIEHGIASSPEFKT